MIKYLSFMSSKEILIYFNQFIVEYSKDSKIS
jgi:hypothetical protein